MKIVDLSHVVHETMPTYPTVSAPKIETVSDGALWASADLRYRPPLVTSLFYVATGATLADHGAAKNKTGADLAFGFDPRIGGTFRPFAEGKWVIYRWYTSFTVQGGLAVEL